MILQPRNKILPSIALGLGSYALLVGGSRSSHDTQAPGMRELLADPLKAPATRAHPSPNFTNRDLLSLIPEDHLAATFKLEFRGSTLQDIPEKKRAEVQQKLTDAIRATSYYLAVEKDPRSAILIDAKFHFIARTGTDFAEDAEVEAALSHEDGAPHVLLTNMFFDPETDVLSRTLRILHELVHGRQPALAEVQSPLTHSMRECAAWKQTVKDAIKLQEYFASDLLPDDIRLASRGRLIFLENEAALMEATYEAWGALLELNEMQGLPSTLGDLALRHVPLAEKAWVNITSELDKRRNWNFDTEGEREVKGLLNEAYLKSAKVLRCLSTAKISRYHSRSVLEP